MEPCGFQQLLAQTFRFLRQSGITFWFNVAFLWDDILHGIYNRKTGLVYPLIQKLATPCFSTSPTTLCIPFLLLITQPHRMYFSARIWGRGKCEIFAN